MIDVFKREIAQELSHIIQKSADDIISSIEKPKNFDHGHLAFPVFSLAKEKKQAPPVIANEITQNLKGKIKNISEINVIGGFINFKIAPAAMQSEVFKNLKSPETVGDSNVGNSKKVVIDFSSPNIAKPMHIGHLRTTVVGQAIKNLAMAQGYDVIAVNHIGDWCSQFGKLAWAIQNWGKEYDFQTEPMKKLAQLYVRFHEEAEKILILKKKDLKLSKN